MESNNVSFVIHNNFYKIFFQKHKEMMEKFIEIKFTSLNTGYTDLMVFYSAYAYYINSEFNGKELILENQANLRNNEKYNRVSKKLLVSGVNSLTYTELIDLNSSYYKEMYNILKVFESFCHRFGIDDIMPKLTGDTKEHDRNVIYASYSQFYECLYDMHSKVYEKLANFNILEYKEVTKIIMCVYFGYSYYINRKLRSKVEADIRELFEITNTKEFNVIYFRLLHNNLVNGDVVKLNDYRDKLFNKAIGIFEFINEELPKTNLMPKKVERILVDTTGI